MHRWGLYEWLLSFAVVISYSSDFAEESELKPLYSDYALKLDGLDLCGLGQKPHRIGSHRFHRFPQIFLIYAVIGSRGTQISQILGDLADNLQNSCFFLGRFEEKA